MFDNLTERLNRALKKVSGKGRITEDNIKTTSREVRMALLEADVALPVVKDFITKIKYRALGKEVQGSLSPGQAFIKIVNDELVKAMGEANERLELKAAPPAVILLAGFFLDPLFCRSEAASNLELSPIKKAPLQDSGE